MAWALGVTVQFAEWYLSLDVREQGSVRYSLALLAEAGPSLGRPHVDTLRASRYPNMKELRTQHGGRPYRMLFAFDPARTAMILIGGDKTGDPHWYERMIPIADRLFEEHLARMKDTER
jgi:hypothetical protein